MAVLRELTISEFQSTFVSPMRLQAEDEPNAVNIKEYVVTCVQEQVLPTTLDAIEIPYVYVSSDENYTHVMLFYGVEEQFMVVVTDNTAKTVYGHHTLNLNALYGREQNG